MTTMIDTNDWLTCCKCGKNVAPWQPKTVVGNDLGLHVMCRVCWLKDRAERELLWAEIDEMERDELVEQGQ